jgi:hypothetical protein
MMPLTNRAARWLLASLVACPLLAGAAPRLLERPPARTELPSKPTGPIAIEHRLAARPSVGVPLEIAVTARVAADARDVRIEADASSPSAVLVTPAALAGSSGGLYRWTITVVPLAAEAGYLNVIVSAEVDGIAQADAVTVSLRSAAAPGAAPAAAAEGGESLIALPVRESP